MTNDQMTRRNGEILSFRFRICFGFRASDFVLPLLLSVLFSLTSLRSAFAIAGVDTPPAPSQKHEAKFATPEETKLNNGLRVVVARRPELPLLAAEVLVRHGAAVDPQNLPGTASLTAELLTKGTESMSAPEIARAVESLGGSIDSGAGWHSSVASVVVMSDNAEEALKILADVVRRPAFKLEEIDRLKNQRLDGLRVAMQQPDALARFVTQKVIFGAGAYGHSVTGTLESVPKISRDDITALYQKYYAPQQAAFILVGDVTLAQGKAFAEKFFGDWQKADVPAATIPPAPAQSEARIYLIDRPGSVQTVLQLGTLGIERTSPDYFAVLLADKVLGGGPSGRLFMNLREDKGYTYGAYSNFGGSKFKGTWISSSEVRTDVTEGAMKEFMYELNRMRNEAVSAEELDNAKRAIIGSFALSLEQPTFLLQNIITQKLYNLPADYWDTYPQKVSAITPEDVQMAAKKYIDLGHLQVVAVGDAAKAREILAKYGKVELYDAEGHPVTGSENNR